MLPFKIGNWLINDEGIIWNGPSGKYTITKERLTESGPEGRERMYDWLVHLPEKVWLTREDVYALNTALIFAMEAYNIPFPENLSFIETFIEQEDVMRRK